jgi:hypothetical protein
MQFKIQRPCEHCPFRKDVRPFLTAERAAELRDTLRDDQRWFACHETTGVKGGKRVRAADQSHCAGAMFVLLNEGNQNVAMRLAHVFKLIDIVEMKGTAKRSTAFRNLDQFAKHHAGSL